MADGSITQSPAEIQRMNSGNTKTVSTPYLESNLMVASPQVLDRSADLTELAFGGGRFLVFMDFISMRLKEA